MNREPDFDDLVGTETGGDERERLRGAHELLVQAGPPPELTPRLQQAPTFGESVSSSSSHRRPPVKRRATLLIAAAFAMLVVFVAGYTVATHRNGNTSTSVATLALTGTRLAPHASATLDVWQQREGNWPMTLHASGLPKLGQRSYYEVYLFRNGRPWGSCGTFRVGGSGAVTVTLNAPYTLRNGDSWIVTRLGPTGTEPGPTVLRPATV